MVEHDPDVISIADHIIDVGPKAGQNGGEIVFAGSYQDLLKSGTLTGKALLRTLPVKQTPRRPSGSLPIRDACLHNLKHVAQRNFDIGRLDIEFEQFVGVMPVIQITVFTDSV